MNSSILELPSTPQVAPPHTEQSVVQHVLNELGRPRNLYKANAQQVGKNQYRVNVYCTSDGDRPVRSVAMTDSFFVSLTDQGLECSPALERKYGLKNAGASVSNN